MTKVVLFAIVAVINFVSIGLAGFAVIVPAIIVTLVLITVACTRK
jgi:hypothetical protein